MLQCVFRANGCFEEYFTILNCNVHMRLPEIAHYILWDCRFRDVFALNMTPLNRSVVVVVTCETTPDSADIWHSKCFWLLFFMFLCFPLHHSQSFSPISCSHLLFQACIACAPKKCLDTEATKCLMHYFKSSEKSSSIFYFQNSHIVWYFHI